MGLLRNGEGSLMVGEEGVVFPPEIGKAAETQTLQAEQILHAPHKGKLHGNLLIGPENLLVQHLEVEGIAEVLGMHEIIKTCEHGMVDEIVLVHAAIVLHLQAETVEHGHVLPEIQATGHLHVSTGDGLGTLIGLVVEVVVHEEEGISPIVIVETFEGGSNVLTAQVVKHLEVGLGLGQLAKAKGCDSYSKNSFFRHKT